MGGVLRGRSTDEHSHAHSVIRRPAAPALRERLRARARRLSRRLRRRLFPGPFPRSHRRARAGARDARSSNRSDAARQSPRWVSSTRALASISGEQPLADVDCSEARLRRMLREAAAENGGDLLVDVSCETNGSTSCRAGLGRGALAAASLAPQRPPAVHGDVRGSRGASVLVDSRRSSPTRRALRATRPSWATFRSCRRAMSSRQPWRPRARTAASSRRGTRCASRQRVRARPTSSVSDAFNGVPAIAARAPRP